VDFVCCLTVIRFRRQLDAEHSNGFH
jgi:hypothetical protein